jgi:hypothetical protein
MHAYVQNQGGRILWRKVRRSMRRTRNALRICRRTNGRNRRTWRQRMMTSRRERENLVVGAIS